MTLRSNATVSKIYILFNCCILKKIKFHTKGKNEYVRIFPRLFAFYYVYLIERASKNVFNLFRMT